MPQRTRSSYRAIFLVIFSTIFFHAAAAYAALEFTGVNLSGAEFGQGNLPGTYGSDYLYPNSLELGYFASKGMNIIRLPFRWERLQTTPDATLDPTELARMDAVVNSETKAGIDVILDPHNFMRYYPVPVSGRRSTTFENSTGGLIGGTVPDAQGDVVTDADFANFWGQLAAHYANNPRVMFGLMNEPNAVPEAQLINSENAAIASIRATGSKNTILVAGNSFTGAWTWNNQNGTTTPATDTSNAAQMLNIIGITDPKNNIIVDMHQYMDSNGSGTSAGIANNDPMIGVERLTAATQWLEANNIKGFLGEFAVDNSIINGADPSDPNTLGNEVLNNMLQYMEAHSDAWEGFTVWGGGPLWPANSLFHIDQFNGHDQPEMAVLQQYLAGLPEPSSLAIFGAGAIFLGMRRRNISA
jgi:endoglucanase